MLSKIVIFLSIVAFIEADPACPDPDGGDNIPCVFVPECQFAENGTVTPLGTQCSNQLSDADCEQLFPCDADGSPACNPTTAVEDPDADSYPYVRSPACTNPDFQDIALQCAKQCALCCQAPEYNCDDDTNSPIECATNTDKCNDADWIEIMAQYCPKTCGLCNNGTCRDLNSGCDTMTSLCKNVDSIDFMKANCARTCGFCTGGNSGCTDQATNCDENVDLCTNDIYKELMLQQCCATCNGTSGDESCSDSDSNCVNWVNNGFCSSSFYSQDQKIQYCAKSCNLC